VRLVSLELLALEENWIGTPIDSGSIFFFLSLAGSVLVCGREQRPS
jgi:hypothetical protein